MMKHEIYTLYDRVTNTYGDLVLAANQDDCKRRVAYAMKSNPYVNDLALYFVGTYDCDLGQIYLSPDKFKFVCNLVECYDQEGV